jgi:hypothetical protein
VWWPDANCEAGDVTVSWQIPCKSIHPLKWIGQVEK